MNNKELTSYEKRIYNIALSDVEIMAKDGLDHAEQLWIHSVCKKLRKSIIDETSNRRS